MHVKLLKKYYTHFDFSKKLVGLAIAKPSES